MCIIGRMVVLHKVSGCVLWAVWSSCIRSAGVYYRPYGRHAYGQRVCIIGRMVVMHKVSGCVL